MFGIYNQLCITILYQYCVYICILFSLIKIFIHFFILIFQTILKYLNIFKYFQYFNILIFNISMFFIFLVKEDSKYYL